MPYAVIMHYSCIFGEQCVVFTNAFLICGLDLMHEDLINVHIFRVLSLSFLRIVLKSVLTANKGANRMCVRCVIFKILHLFTTNKVLFLPQPYTFKTSQYIDCL